ncbi:MAG: Hint domain-containing protein [Minicystis sp.]
MAPPDTSVVLNHADERQHRFVEMRLKMAGKTRGNAPELFKRIDETRAQHVAMGLKAGQFVPKSHGELARDADPGRVTQHYMSSVGLLTSSSLQGISLGSNVGTLTYGYIDSGVWDSDGAPLGNMNYAEVYTNMPYATVASTGNLALTQRSEVFADSMLVTDSPTLGHSERYTVKGRPTIGAGSIQWKAPVIQAPVDLNSDGCYSICLNRSWTNDCDVDLTSTQQALRIPLKGSITIDNPAQGNYRIDENKVAQYAAGTATFTGGAHDDGGSVTVVLKSDGGGCNLGAKGATYSMQSFWKKVTLTDAAGNTGSTSSNKVTLSWDLTGADAAEFNQACRLVQDGLQLDMSVTVPWIYSGNNNTFSGQESFSFSSNPSATPTTKLISCIKETNSCLASGTQIEMADGAQKPIESIHDGDRVLTPNAKGDLQLTISDTAKGIETVPMVRIEDERGHSLLMTEMHPIQVVGRGMVMAKYLQTGDVVQTKEGPSHLVKVARESYDGAVHNLKVGNAAEVQGLGQDQTVVYANGFLVGDGQIQSKYESLEEQAKAHPARVSVPARWRADRLNSKKHSH